MAHQQSQPLTISERMLKVKSLIATSRMATLYQNSEGQSDFFDLSETLELAEEMAGECASDVEMLESKKEKGDEG